ncbi:MAG TPA: 16S rRNA (adenine(1518)-N(6)/adenine(1519)-N(6))-dimethyltransferase RsmA [Bacteroidales bacterium]|nr:16S rRNA (adenine(1518)-N(6)/adenine(1519)-N(6))-dimethyltransferase RsmA [Bacteroidales bacterium]HPR72325.1 16S rRNA (adenine(1518)-N(6)/adenine(1519)-N(6))-dimethyltransferase RsmA [Bacteroidales bacterium]
MHRIRPKKNLGQHFLKDKAIASRIASSLTGEGYNTVLEIGPGSGVLTSFLLQRNFSDFRAIEIDNESYYYLKQAFPGLKNIIRGDFLTMDIDSFFNEQFAVIGNFPYNISSQILFKILDHRDKVTEICGMLQKEVAERICAPPGSRIYGIMSVLLQAYYTAEYLFTVEEEAFVPPPKVKSGVIRLRRNTQEILDCDEKLFFRVVKAGFNQRRKTLRNSLKAVFRLRNENHPDLVLRPEQLSVKSFIELTRWVEENMILSE